MVQNKSHMRSESHWENTDEATLISHETMKGSGIISIAISVMKQEKQIKENSQLIKAYNPIT